MIPLLESLIGGKRIIILGFGREGQSAYRYIHKHFPETTLAVADRNPDFRNNALFQLSDLSLDLYFGDAYLEHLHEFDLILRSPGIFIPPEWILKNSKASITSQTDLMLQAFKKQIIGITGTKGKSTTSSLVYHITRMAFPDTVLVGNIGIPPFDSINDINPETKIVYELSSSQLEDIHVAPHIGVLLNLYPEHLDRYGTANAYYLSKFNIHQGQDERDILIYNQDIPILCELIREARQVRNYLTFSSIARVSKGCFLEGNKIYLSQGSGIAEYLNVTRDIPLKGKFNIMNIMAAILACRSAGINDETIRAGILSFRGLEHRLEYVGQFRGIHFYNDSIATIPEATMEAVRTLEKVDTLILGGYDRNLDFSELVSMLAASGVRNFLFMGKAGVRMMNEFNKLKLHGKKLVYINSLDEAFDHILMLTAEGMICLLSPAAASYDSFKNFEERGNLFKQIARIL